MMGSLVSSERILQALKSVAVEREKRIAEPVLAHSVLAVKAYQHQRFSQTYADLLASPRFAGAARFFLEDLYGPGDFIERDRQFARVVPALVRLFPSELVSTVAMLAQLHALSEKLDTLMGAALIGQEINRGTYAHAWRVCGCEPERALQIDLTVQVGAALDRYTRKVMLRQTLRLMRSPAQLAGLSALQHFLERGFDTFRALGGADEFLRTISTRERRLAAELFEDRAT